jgi:hypothetical protein
MRFFGRQSIIELLNRRVVDLKEGYRQNVALIGPEFVGKTSIVEEFLSRLDDEKIIPVYLSLDEPDFNSFVDKFIGRLLFNFLKNNKAEENIEILLEQAQRLIPATCLHIKKIRQGLERDKRLDTYRDLLGLPEVFEQESGRFCLIILDEFQNLEEFNLPNAFLELGKKIMVQKHSIYLVTSSSRLKAQKILAEKLSLLFGNFEVVEVGPFSIKASLEFIEDALKGHYLEKSCKNFLVDFTGGHPFYLNVICKKLITTAREEGQNNIFQNVLIDGLGQILFDKWGLLNQHFSKTVNSLSPKKGKNLAAAILLVVAEGHNKLPEILDGLSANKSSVPAKLNQMVESRILTKNGNLFCITDKLFVFWLRLVYRRRLKSLQDSEPELSAAFKNDLKQRINSFIQISGNDLEARIMDLMQSFDNELFQLNGHKHRLPSFSAIRPLNFNGYTSQNLKGLVAETSDDLWAVTFKEGMILDSDVAAFLSSTKDLDRRVTRRVVISINEIDTNARLRALQEKMWIWNISDLNFILNLYGKPYIVK